MVMIGKHAKISHRLPCALLWCKQWHRKSKNCSWPLWSSSTSRILVESCGASPKFVHWLLYGQVSGWNLTTIWTMYQVEIWLLHGQCIRLKSGITVCGKCIRLKSDFCMDKYIMPIAMLKGQWKMAKLSCFFRTWTLNQTWKKVCNLVVWYGWCSFITWGLWIEVELWRHECFIADESMAHGCDEVR